MTERKKISLKIRDSEKQKIPYMLAIGDQEVSNQTVALRKRKVGNLGVLKQEEVRERLLQEINIKG